MVGYEQGQHIELGIAENNLFLMLAAAGLAGDLFGTRLFPDRDALRPVHRPRPRCLNYACYQDARFLLVATPSGITLGPEGGAHQSINPPLIALGQPGLRHYEPAYADELAAMMELAFRLIDDPGGEAPICAFDPQHPAVERPTKAGAKARSQAAIGCASRARARSRDRRHGRGDAGGARGLGGTSRGHSGPRPAFGHLARPAASRLDGRAGARAGAASGSPATSRTCSQASGATPVW